MGRRDNGNKIIVIGMDNTGKTTLVDYLNMELFIRQVKSPGPKLTKKQMSEIMYGWLSSDEDLIIERFSLFEEITYGNVLRRNSKFDLNGPEFEYVKKVKPIIIYCRPDDFNVFNFGDREQMVGVIEQADKLLKAWDNLVGELEKQLTVIRYNYNNKTMQELANEVREKLN